jgi:hypothetical protein
MSDSLLMGILAIPIAIAGALVALEAGPLRQNDRVGDRPARKQTASHPIRLAFFMLLGAAIGLLFPRPIGNGLDPWIRYAWFVHAFVGSLIGLCIELYVRINDTRTRHEILLAAVICGLLATLCAIFH